SGLRRDPGNPGRHDQSPRDLGDDPEVILRPFTLSPLHPLTPSPVQQKNTGPDGGLPSGPASGCPTRSRQLPPRPVLTSWKVWLAFWPRVVMAAMQTTMIKASITAYSTAVGPSSRFRNLTTGAMNFDISTSPFGSPAIRHGP